MDNVRKDLEERGTQLSTAYGKPRIEKLGEKFYLQHMENQE